jgi:DNA-binding transcriptional LysR family regulator
LGISRSAISQHMNDLEGRLGFSLCQRGRGGFSLTEEGKEIYQAGLTLLTALETFKSDVNALHHTIKGELNIGITVDILPSLSLRCRLAAERKGIPRSLPSWFLLRCSLPSMPWHCWSYTNSTGVHSRVPLGMIFQPSAPANSAVPACRMLRAAFTSRSMP